MKLIYPEFLYALASISIPIIIHLFNFRKFKKVYFTNIRFLREVKEETQSKSRLKHLLVLISRILAITALVLAFAQPYIPLGNAGIISNKAKTIGIYIDNSFSMDAEGKAGNLLDEAKKKALEIAESSRETDRFQLLTNDFESKHQRLVSKEEFIQNINEIQSSPSVKMVSEIISRQKDALFSPDAAEGEKISYLISDFQKRNSDFKNIKSDSDFVVHFVPLTPQKRNNVYIDTVWFDTPVIQENQAQNCFVRIVNDSENEIENQPLKLIINDIQKGLSSISMKAGETIEAKISFTITESGWQNGEVNLTDYPLTFDDSYFFAFDVAKSIQVLSINGGSESPYLNALFGKDPYFEFKNAPAGRIDYSSFSMFQLIVLNQIPAISSGLAQEITKFVSNGGSIVIFPATDTDVNSYNVFLKSLGVNTIGNLLTNEEKISRIEFQHEIFKDVFEKENIKIENMDLPFVKKYYPFISSGFTNEEALLKMQSGQTFLSKYTVKKGKVYMFGVPLHTEYSNFVRHAVFVPVLYKMALLSKTNYPFSYYIGINDLIEYNETSSGDKVFHLSRSKNNFDIIPEHRSIIDEGKTVLFLHNRISHAGHYSLKNSNDELAVFSFNYDRRESSLKVNSVEEIETEIKNAGLKQSDVLNIQGKDFSQEVVKLSEGIKLWKWFLILALLFLGLEIVLIRLVKS